MAPASTMMAALIAFMRSNYSRRGPTAALLGGIWLALL